MAQFDNREITRFRRMMPVEALQLPFGEIMRSLSKILGPQLYPAFDPSASIPSPLEERRDTSFLKTANTVGINIRTIQHFWNAVPYSLVLPKAQNAIHILPIWEPGVVASLYGPASWNVNPEFFSPQLAAAFPHLDTVEKHLKVTVNILHLLGKVVGVDVVPHTDRYSEMALANPHLFEWLQRRDMEIAAHDAHLHRKVQTLLFEHLLQQGSAVRDVELPTSPEAFFEKTTENTRLRVLFGEKYDYWGRLFRRKEMVRLLHAHGYETVPATMGPPYRGLEVDPRPEAQVVDEEGLVWRDYRLVRPQKFSRVFGPLARYRLYESKDDNQNWELDFGRPNHAAWAYCAEHYRSIVAEYGFDFMRGDMSHVQMRPGGVPAVRDEYYDLLGAVKRAVLRDKPYFGYFAESFLAPPNEMAYGDECAHLEAAMADSTLGDLQSEPVGTEQFVRTFWQYRQWLETRKFAPNFTIMTADKDDPRFDRFYLDGNEMRHFIALFLTDMPSYMGLGFECRDPHPQPAPNECYSKYYVFQMPNDPKTTNGPYRWGQNKRLYENLVRQKLLSDEIMVDIRDAKTAWLLPPDPNGHDKVIAWTQRDTPRYLFVANLDTQHAQYDVAFEAPWGHGWKMIFSTEQAQFEAGAEQSSNILVEKLLPGEGVVFSRV
ncbi:MAG: hypothetical protein KIS77_02745 [Saprospiraceae bacterium]|nr:hypothetical protein [Saprospiraceae bacterium]